MVTGIFPPDTGGPASYVPAISELLWRDGHLIGVVTLSDEAEVPSVEHDYPVTRILRGQNKLIRRIKTISSIYSQSKQADVVYLNGLVLEGVMAARMLARKPVVVKVVGDLIWEHARNRGVTRLDIDEFQTSRSVPLLWKLLRAVQSRYMRAANRVIVPSRYLSSVVAGWGVAPANLQVIYNAVEVAPWANAPTPAYDLVTVARLVPWKGIRELIEIAAAKGWAMLVVGDGPLRAQLEEQAAALGARVTFAGHVPKREVGDLIRQAKVFVLNSTYEGLPHIVLEAKLAQRVVVATAVGGTPETIDQGVNGYLVPLGDRAALTSTLEELLTDDALRDRVAAAGETHAKTQFSFANMYGEAKRALHDVAKGV